MDTQEYYDAASIRFIGLLKFVTMVNSTGVWRMILWREIGSSCLTKESQDRRLANGNFRPVCLILDDTLVDLVPEIMKVYYGWIAHVNR